MKIVDNGCWGRRGAFVYAVINERVGAAYIGSTKTTLSKRSSSHVCELGRGTHPTRRLQADWDRYGEQSFYMEVLEEVTSPHDLRVREDAWMQTYSEAGWLLYNIQVPKLCANKASYRRVGRRRGEFSGERIGEFTTLPDRPRRTPLPHAPPPAARPVRRARRRSDP